MRWHKGRRGRWHKDDDKGRMWVFFVKDTKPTKTNTLDIVGGVSGEYEIALRFLLSQALDKGPDFSPEGDGLSIRDTKTKLTLSVAGQESAGRCVYEISATGEAPSIPARLRLVVAGFVRYGEMENVGDAEVAFPCGQRHDRLMGILMPYSRNISAVENMMEADAMRGQMTTSTLGFSAT